MTETAGLLITLGVLLLLGLATDALGQLTRLPRVTLLLLLGLALGPAGFALLPSADSRVFAMSTQTALVMVGFLLGERFTPAAMQERGRSVVLVSVIAVLLTGVCVAGLLLMAGAPFELACLLGAVSTSTAPAATVDVVEQEGRDTPFGRLLLGVVAVDVAWGLVLFGLVGAGVGIWADGGTPAATLLEGVREVGGALLLGGALGVPVAALTARLRPGEPTLLEALGAVFLCGGLALWLHVSPLLAAMSLGATVANLARHHERPFHSIRDVERPFLVVFFVFAGALLDLAALETVGFVGLVYLVGRIVGRLLGGFVGCRVAGEGEGTAHWMGVALLPQAGVALGLAIIAAERFPELAVELVPVVIGSTVVFELFGPLGTRAALRAVD